MLLKTIRAGKTSERMFPVIKALIPRTRRLGIEVARATPGVPQGGHDDRHHPKSNLHALVAGMGEPMMTGHTIE